MNALAVTEKSASVGAEAETKAFHVHLALLEPSVSIKERAHLHGSNKKNETDLMHLHILGGGELRASELLERFASASNCRDGHPMGEFDSHSV